MLRFQSSLMSIFRICAGLFVGLLFVAGGVRAQAQSDVLANATQQPEIIRANASAILADIASSRSRATIVNMWATWCSPCLEELPGLIAFVNGYSSEEVRLVLVSVDSEEQWEEVADLLSELGWTEKSFLKDQKDQPFVNAFSLDWTGAVPATFVFKARKGLYWHTEGLTPIEDITGTVIGLLH